jgi:hypothetical protein
LAAEKGHKALVDVLLDHGAYLDLEADHKLTPIFLASQFGHLECLEILLKCAKDRGRGCVSFVFVFYLQIVVVYRFSIVMQISMHVYIARYYKPIVKYNHVSPLPGRRQFFCTLCLSVCLSHSVVNTSPAVRFITET